LENNKQTFASEFVQRPRFTSAYPDHASPAAAAPLVKPADSPFILQLTNTLVGAIVKQVAEDDRRSDIKKF
jgi:hypothetical protein